MLGVRYRRKMCIDFLRILQDAIHYDCLLFIQPKYAPPTSVFQYSPQMSNKHVHG